MGYCRSSGYCLRAPRRRRFIDRDRDGLLVFFVCIILFRVAAAVYFLTHLLVAAAPVVMLASLIAVSRVASNAPRRGVGQWGGASGAICEDHFGVARGGMRVAFDGEAFCCISSVLHAASNRAQGAKRAAVARKCTTGVISQAVDRATHQQRTLQP